jgi:hypothetical protein
MDPWRTSKARRCATRLVNLLRSKTCRTINFEVLNIPVRGIAYNTVAEAIGRDFQRRDQHRNRRRALEAGRCPCRV